ncbi:hypothetical protein B5M09_010776 [Aphanomyces astaci]|uniref:Uncharacterized protein n=1 Tax=Aphanomyces astaci TaxID=112090 RepID=A0A425D2D6_APHAT|nr:hypothetical protein B5M09_010776 [Aphanomyces astaci]
MDVTPRARPPGRPRLKEGPKKPPKKFRNVNVSFKKKQAVIDCFDEMGMAAALLKHFPHLRGPPIDTTRKKVYTWLKQRAHRVVLIGVDLLHCHFADRPDRATKKVTFLHI